MPGWNVAAVWDGIAAEAPHRTAIVAGDRHTTWAEFADRAHHLAWHLGSALSLVPGDRVAVALPNRPEYLEAFYATLCIRGVPVNVNPRYGTNEIGFVLDDSDAKIVIHEPSAAKTMRTAARRIPKPWRPKLLEVGAPYEDAIARAALPDGSRPTPDGNDLIFLYRGAADRKLVAAMWRNDDLVRGLATSREAIGAGRVLTVAPFAHATGLLTALATLTGGGTLVVVDSSDFDASLVWSAVERARVETLSIVGDAHARPLLAALRDGSHHWDLSSLRTISSSGAACSAASTRGFHEQLPQVDVAQSLGGSEALGTSVNNRVTVLGEETLQPVLPGSGEIGLLAMTGFLPVGFWKDAARTAATFRVVDGTRYLVPGDYATVDADGVVHLTGRGSDTINSGGASVDPETIEARLRKHASVEDCAVVGVPDSRLGERLVALVIVTANHYLDEAELSAWCRSKLADHETPKRFLFVDTLHRHASGGVNHRQLRELAIERLDRE